MTEPQKQIEDSLMQRALVWWASLDSSQKFDYENKTFGYPENWWEDTTIVEQDILTMYKKYVL